MDNWFILVLVAASALGTWLTFKALRASRQKQEDYGDFARQNGWTYEHIPGGRQQALTDRFRDPRDDWTLEMRFSGGGPTGGSTKRVIEWHSPTGALESGEAVLGMVLPEKSVRMMSMGGEIGKKVLKAALKGTFYALGNTRFNLTIDEATAGDPGGVVMSTAGQEGAMNGLRRSAALADFRGRYKEQHVPVIIRNEDGLSLRLPGAPPSTEYLNELVALGKSLRADL